MISFRKFWQKMEQTKTVKVMVDGQVRDMKLTQYLLCDLTGLSNNVINALVEPKEGVEYKCKKGNVSISSIEVLCDFFDCQPCDLMEYVDEV